MQLWQIVIIPIITIFLQFLARPIEIAFLRKRTGAINSIRVLSEFFYRHRDALNTAEAVDVVSEIDDCLKYPNSLGSEAQLAKLVGRVCTLVNVSSKEIQIVDRALNSLDQRATERDRSLTK